MQQTLEYLKKYNLFMSKKLFQTQQNLSEKDNIIAKSRWGAQVKKYL